MNLRILNLVIIAGFVIREIVEPKPTIETIQTYPAAFTFDNDRFILFIIFDCLKI